jgi:hypothetical protein
MALLPLVAALLLGQVPPPRPPAEAPAALREEQARLLREEAAALEALAVALEGDGQADAARAARDAIQPPPPPDGPQVFVPRPEFEPSGRGAGLASRPAVAPEARIGAIRRDSAKALFDLARRAADARVGRLGLADELLRAVLDRDPDHAEARRLLGFVAYKNGWATPFAADQLRQNKVLHPKFGWVPPSWVEHLDRGELPGVVFRGDQPTEWLPAAEADALRRDFHQRPWTITTEHFHVRTNVPLDEAIAFGRRLEDYYQLFFSLLADAVGRERLPLAQRFANPRQTPRTAARRHEVWYFAERSEYLDFFRQQFGRDESTSLGYTMPPAEARALAVPPRSYFYRDRGNPIDATSTLFHEASHQLLFESAGPTRFDRNLGNYWVWEGLGTYFETARIRDDGAIEIGGLVGPRIDEARRRILERGEFVPIGDLVAMGRERFGDDVTVHRNYAEAMALVVFLMHGQGRAYRDGFLDYVRAAYDGRAGKGHTLDGHLGVGYLELDRQFLAFLRGGGEAPVEDAPPTIRARTVGR